jgi:hypothetical protein
MSRAQHTDTPAKEVQALTNRLPRASAIVRRSRRRGTWGGGVMRLESLTARVPGRGPEEIAVRAAQEGFTPIADEHGLTLSCLAHYDNNLDDNNLDAGEKAALLVA